MNSFVPELFTIISLMIGLFGGTISAIVFIKAAGDRRVQHNLAQTDAKIDEMVEAGAKEESLTDADQYRCKIERCRGAFRILTLIPIVFFALWIFLTSFYVSLSAECKPLFDYSQQIGQSSEITDSNQTPTPGKSDSSGIQMTIADICVFLKGYLFSRRTCFIITLVDALCIYIAYKFLRRAKKQYQEVEKLHKTIMSQTKPEYKKTQTS